MRAVVKNTLEGEVEAATGARFSFDKHAFSRQLNAVEITERRRPLMFFGRIPRPLQAKEVYDY